MAAAIRQYFFVLLGAFSAAIGLKLFLLPNHFVDGGITGISMILSALTGGNLAVLLFLINIPFLAIATRSIGKVFGLKSAIGILVLSIMLASMGSFSVTDDKLLSAIFGGVCIGAGVGLSIRGGGVLDGTEVLALIFSKRTGFTVGDLILSLNLIVFSVAGFTFGVTPALYSIVAYFCAAKAVDYFIHGFDEYFGVSILSHQSAEIRGVILGVLGRGVTRYRAIGGLSQVEQEALFCVVTRLELPKLKRMVEEIDQNAFIVVQHVSEIVGGVVKRSPIEKLHH